MQSHSMKAEPLLTVVGHVTSEIRTHATTWSHHCVYCRSLPKQYSQRLESHLADGSRTSRNQRLVAKPLRGVRLYNGHSLCNVEVRDFLDGVLYVVHCTSGKLTRGNDRCGRPPTVAAALKSNKVKQLEAFTQCVETDNNRIRFYFYLAAPLKRRSAFIGL